MLEDMRGRTLLLICIAAALLPVLGACDGERPRGLILVSLDTLRFDHLGHYGYNRPTSPNLDALAAQSVVFERAIAQASSTMPSHRSLFQARHSSAYQPGLPSLAQVLQQNGFRTAAFTGGGNISARHGFGQGFEEYLEQDGGLTEALPEVERWLREGGPDPFFLFLHTYDIHLPYDPPAPHSRLFFPDYDGFLLGSHTRELLRKVRRLGIYKNEPEGQIVSEKDRRRVVALYDGGIHFTDGLFGQFMTLLDQLELLEEVIVVVFSDHGEEFWDHGSVIHSHTVYEELIHVPMLWRLPNQKFAGRRVPSPVRLMDLAPTALELLGLTTPSSFQGRSFSGLMEGGEEEARPILSEMHALQSWTEFPWKRIEDLAGGKPQLFNLQEDPGEQRNLHDSHPEIATTLEAHMTQTLSSYSRVEVRELDPGVGEGELHDRLKELGYVD
jgi:arylsulfatase A-like enzyme